MPTGPPYTYPDQKLGDAGSARFAQRHVWSSRDVPTAEESLCRLGIPEQLRMLDICVFQSVSQSAYLGSIFQNTFFFVLFVAEQPEGMVHTLNSLACLEAAPTIRLRYGAGMLGLLSGAMYNTQIQSPLATSIPNLFLFLFLLFL